MTSEHSDTIELSHIARTVARGWRSVVGFTVLGIAVAAGVLLFAPRKYSGVTTVVLKSGTGAGGASSSSVLSQITGLGDITAGLLGGKSPMETEIEVMSSRAVVGDVIDSLRLQAEVIGSAPLASRLVISALDAPTPFKRKRYRFERNADRTFRYSGNGEQGAMVPGTPTRLATAAVTFSPTGELPSTFDLVVRDKADAIDWVSKHLVVDKGKGEVLSITYRGDDSVTAASLPNTLLDIYLARRRGTDRGINQRRVEFLTAKSDSMEKALAGAAQALRRQQEASGVLDPSAMAKVELESGSLLRGKLTDVLVEQGALRQLMDQINSKTSSPRNLAAYPRFINSPIINGLVSQLSDFDTRRTIMLTTHTDSDRDIVALDKSAADVEAKILPYARTYADALAKERADLEASIDRVNANLARLPKAAESSGQLESDVVGLTKLTAGLQGQIVEAKLAAIGEGGDVRPLDRAEIPKKPSFPTPFLTASIGTIGGLICGLIAAILVGSVGRWMRDPIEVERVTGVPAIQFDPAVPLLLTNGASRTLLVAPL